MSEPLLDLLRKYRDTARSEREKGAYFERLIKIFLENDDIQKQYYSAVVSYGEWAQAQGWSAADTGIDLVATLADGSGYAAVQCKFYALAILPRYCVSTRNGLSAKTIRFATKTAPCKSRRTAIDIITSKPGSESMNIPTDRWRYFMGHENSLNIHPKERKSPASKNKLREPLRPANPGLAFLLAYGSQERQSRITEADNCHVTWTGHIPC